MTNMNGNSTTTVTPGAWPEISAGPVTGHIRSGNKDDVIEDGFVRLSQTHDISFTEDHVADIDLVAAQINAAVQAGWSKRHEIRYSKAYVLVLFWEQDDLGVHTEINELRDVFEDNYHFEVQEYKIPNRKPHRSVMNRVEEFLNLESKETLLIVYYAGHAKRGRQSNQAAIWFANRRDLSIEFSSGGIQGLLEESDSDVLLLYDCCHSAIIPVCGTRPGKGGVTEVIAACGFEATAPEVDEHSFTRALIHTLRVLSREPPFSVAQLHAQTLSRLKCWSPGFEKRPGGEYVYERQPRRTPIYSILSETNPRRSIELGPLPLKPPLIPNNGFPNLDSSQALPTSSATPLDIFENQEPCTSAHFKCAQVLLAIRVDKTDLNEEQWVEWIRKVPEEGVDIRIEGRYGSFSTLLLLRMPIAVWNLLPEHPAYSFVGFVTSENLVRYKILSRGENFLKCNTLEPLRMLTTEIDQGFSTEAETCSPEDESSAGSWDLGGINTPISDESMDRRVSSPQLSQDPGPSGPNLKDGEGEFQPRHSLFDFDWTKISNLFERLGSGAGAVILRKKVLFISGVLNILISGYIIGASPQIFHYWYTIQLLYLMPIRYYTYYRRGWNYFLADLCYFVNFLCICAIWLFPHSTTLFIGTYCLAFGNNAFGIALWRNSMVFHSLEKTTTVFVHIMPCVALHCLVHLLPPDLQQQRFPAIWAIKTFTSVSQTHNYLSDGIFWSTVTYAAWQVSYYFMISQQHREEIAAGRPTSFTWLRNSFSKVYCIGEYIKRLPKSSQEPIFMIIQYCYVVLTTVPCPIWFWYRYASGGFLLVAFCWTMYNSATYYIEIFGKYNSEELEDIDTKGQKWQDITDPVRSVLDTQLRTMISGSRVEV